MADTERSTPEGREGSPGARRPELAPILPAPFVVGVGRSGTTLLRLMLDAHPDLAVPPETRFIPDAAQACDFPSGTSSLGQDLRACVVQALTSAPRWPDLGIDCAALVRRLDELAPFTLSSAIRAFYGLYAARFDKPRWGDKSTPYIHHMALIQRLLPEARFVHIIRDGRDVWLSVRELSWSPGSAEAAAESWSARVAEARAQGSGLPFYLEVRFEELVLAPEATLQRICHFVELPWDPAMLGYHVGAAERLAEKGDLFDPCLGRVKSGEERRRKHALTSFPPQPDRVGRWRAEMDNAERQRYEAVAGPLLRELGYEVG